MDSRLCWIHSVWPDLYNCRLSPHPYNCATCTDTGIPWLLLFQAGAAHDTATTAMLSFTATHAAALCTNRFVHGCRHRVCTQAAVGCLPSSHGDRRPLPLQQ
eukprot:GHUV01045321.1.p1 GENE.GHUV01045321.1~~GHUV01045321.1.p1  ORF type:complete len:102 (-),score=9.89 GHUV01045321.1:59-364(-)